MMAENQNEDDREGEIGLVILYTALACVSMSLLNFTPLHFVDDVVFILLKILFWPVVILILFAWYEDEKGKSLQSS